jgi:glycolate oxidase FAD binding subunit
LIIDGVDAGRVLEPKSVEELVEVVGAGDETLAPFGHGTRLAFGNPLAPIDTAIDMTGLDRVQEYVPADLTVHVEAGIRLGRLQEILSEHNQMLPLDPWCGPESTLGGIVATNSHGPFRAVGSIRDWIIGMQVVHADGRLSRTGGRVVKNVSGYDLAKLYTGSLGSLGIVTEVSLKLRSCYDATGSARIRMPDTASSIEMVRRLRAGPWDPVSFVWTGPQNEIRLRFGEHRKAVEWQLAELPDGDWEVFEQEGERDLWREAGELYDALGETVIRVSVRPDSVGELIESVAPSAWLVHGSNGIVLMSVGSDLIDRLRSEYPVIVERAPLDVRRTISTFGMRGTEYQIMRDLKDALDPGARLNPGRHVDGEHRA